MEEDIEGKNINKINKDYSWAINIKRINCHNNMLIKYMLFIIFIYLENIFIMICKFKKNIFFIFNYKILV